MKYINLINMHSSSIQYMTFLDTALRSLKTVIVRYAHFSPHRRHKMPWTSDFKDGSGNLCRHYFNYFELVCCRQHINQTYHLLIIINVRFDLVTCHLSLIARIKMI